MYIFNVVFVGVGRNFAQLGHGARAVSYTHLRAHETVLDLVCRLLLEKKTTARLNPVIPTRHTPTHTNRLPRYQHPAMLLTAKTRTDQT